MYLIMYSFFDEELMIKGKSSMYHLMNKALKQEYKFVEAEPLYCEYSDNSRKNLCCNNLWLEILSGG